jgi:ribosomal protein L34E
MELTTNQKPLKRCIVLMKMNGMVNFNPIELKTLSNEHKNKERSYAALRYKI